MESAEIVTEINEQIGRVHAERVEKRLAAEITSYNGSNDLNHTLGTDRSMYDNLLLSTVAGAATDTMNVRRLLTAKKLAFGDKSGAAVVCFMHSLQLLDLMADTGSGFLKADANNPFSMINGYEGRITKMVIIESDLVPKLPMQIDGKDAYLAHFHKVNAYGIIEKKDFKMEDDKDILSRKMIWVGTQWYGVKSFHRKISSKDDKSGALITTVNNQSIRAA